MSDWPNGFKRDTELKTWISYQLPLELNTLQILNTLEEGLIIFDSQGKPVFFNPSALDILKTTPEKLNAYHLFLDGPDMFLESGEVCPPAAYAGRIALQQGINCFKQVLGRDLPNGERVWISQNATPFFEPDQRKVQGVMLTFRDISEQVHQLQELKNREKSLIEAQRIARFGFWEWEIATNQLHWSPEIYQIFGRTPQEFTATYPNFLQIIPLPDRKHVEIAVQKALDEHSNYSVEHRLILPTGEIRYVHEQGEVIRDSGGHPIKMLGVVKDITEAKQAQLSLIAEQTRLELALDCSGLGVMEWDLWEDRISIDTRLAEMMGRSQAEILTLSDFELAFPQAQSTQFFYHLDLLLETQEPFETEFWLNQNQENEKKYLKVHGKSLLNEQNQTYRIIAVFLDITEHKLIEQRLEEQIQLRTLNLKETLKEKDRRMQELDCLYAIAKRLHDKAPSSELVKDVISLLEMGFNEPGDWCFELDLSGEYAICECKHESQPLREFKIQLEDGHTNGYLRLYKGLHASPHLALSSQEEDLLQGVAYMLEQTWQRQLSQEALKLAREEAESANRSKSLFLANMSHEIRTPLTAIQGFSELLRSELKEPHLHTYLDIIQNNKQTLMVLLQDILDLSKVEAGKLLFHPASLELKGLLQDLWLMFQTPFLEKGISFQLTLPEEHLPPILQDEHRLRQIINNLLNNALKFTETGQVILSLQLLSQSETQLGIEIQVKDTGIGVPSEFQNFLFQPFEQFHNQTHVSGAGLGLSIASRLAELMKGELKYAPEQTGGSCFSLCLPEQAIAEFSNSPKQLRHQVYPLKQFKPALVLIADDVWENRLFLEQTLDKLGLDHLSACDGKQALELAINKKPALILLDLRMPVMNGQEVLKALKNHPETFQIPVLALTASGLLEEELTLKHAGFDGYLRKPFSMGELQNLLNLYLPQSSPTQPPPQILPLSKSRTKEMIDAINNYWIPECEKIKNSVIINDINKFINSINDFHQKYNLNILSHCILQLNEKCKDYDLIEISDLIQELQELLQNMIQPQEDSKC